MDVRGATQNAKSRGIFAVEAELLAQRIRDRSASFLRNQHGGGDVPFVTPADSCDKVRLIGSHHRHPERDAVGLVHLCQVEIRSDEHKSELQQLMRISYAVFC